MSDPTISKYFAKSGSKRKPSSTSSTSDACNSPETAKTKQDKKKQKQQSDCSLEEMAVQNQLEEINQKLGVLTAAQEDIKQIRQDIDKMSVNLVDKIDRLESVIFDLKTEKDKLSSEVRKLKEDNTDLRSRVDQQQKETDTLRQAQNDMEQHGRQFNLRVFGVKEDGTAESVTDCVQKCVDIFTNKVGVPVTVQDIEIAHRSGRPGTGKPRPILVRFFSRQKKGTVLASRRSLKQSGVSISEDLTRPNYRLLMRAKEHSATLSTWSSNGKVLAKLKNGKILKIDIGTDMEGTFRKAMVG